MEGIDGREAARRCIQAMDETQDVATRKALWRAATRYAKQAREMGATGRSGELERPSLAHGPEGSFSAREGW